MNGTAVDHRPQVLLSCIVNGMLGIRQVREFQKHSDEEEEGVVAELLFENSQIQQEGGAADKQEEFDETTSNGREQALQTEKRQKEKHVIMFTNPVTARFTVVSKNTT